MTNAEKFKEVFRIEPDKEVLPLECNDSCPYRDDYGCHCEKWWDEQYTGGTQHDD